MNKFSTIMIAVAGLYLGIAAIGLALVGVPSTAHALPITTPTVLNPGDQYRLAFVTSTTRDATSSDIAVYNAFVTTAANSQAGLAALGATWKAIGSTSSIAARDNTGTNLSTTGVPIYLLDGTTKIADNNVDLWDKTIDSPFNIFVDGSPAINQFVWTGTNWPGISLSNPLGHASPRVGNTSNVNFGWTQIGPDVSWKSHHFYALSSILTVAAVPEPGTLILYGVGLAFFAVARRRTRNPRRS